MLNNKIKAAISFCLISISSIDNLFSQFDFYLLTAQVALQFNQGNQAEALFKSAVGVLADLAKTNTQTPEN